MNHLLFILSFVLLACHTHKETFYESSSTNEPLQTQTSQKFGEQIMIDTAGNGDYFVVELPENEWPQSNNGMQGFLESIYSGIRYPAAAREHGIGGTVLLDIWVNELGQTTDVTVEKSVHPDLDKESLRVTRSASQVGFTPLIYHGEAVPFRLRMPVKFRVATPRR